jgi:hypothetical protein
VDDIMINVQELYQKQVQVTMNTCTGDVVFEGTLVDFTANNKTVWVERNDDKEWVCVNLSNPSINKVEEIVEPVIEVDTHQDMKEIKRELFKEIKYLDDVSIRVMVYDCFENTRSLDGKEDQTYDVEINYYVDGEYQNGFYNQTFVGRFRDDEVAEKMAVTRAKAVLRTVKGWFKNNDDVVVEDGIEVYHA